MDGAPTPSPECQWATLFSTPPSSGNLRRPTGMRNCHSSAPPARPQHPHHIAPTDIPAVDADVSLNLL